MNRMSKKQFDEIRSLTMRLMAKTTSALTDFQSADARAKADSSAYKDETERYQSLRNTAALTALNAIKSAEQEFESDMRAEISTLRDMFRDHLRAKPLPDFWPTMGIYRSYGIAPSRAELDELLVLAQGNTLALTALDSTLRMLKSPYRIEYYSAESFSDDLEDLEHFAHSKMWSPVELHSAACAVWSGQPKIFVNENGEEFTTGATVDSISLLLARSNFESCFKQLDETAERWAHGTIPSVKQVKNYADKTDKDGKTVSAAEQYIADREETGSIVTVTEGGAEDKAREMAAEKNANAAQYQTIMDHYVRRGDAK